MPQTATSTVSPRPARELALLGSLYVAYSLARVVGDTDLALATANARDLLSLERRLGLDVEAWANAVLTGSPWLALAGAFWYALLHYVVTPAALVWAYRRHRARYPWLRNTLVVGSALGLVGFALLPMAPPRMLPGYVDTLAATAEHGWWGESASAPKGLGGLTNELAAMPSLHVGWALWVAWVVFLCTRRTWARSLAVVYAAGTVVVVVATANHFLLDAVAGAVVMGVGAAVTGDVVRGRTIRRGRDQASLPRSRVTA